MSFRNMLERCCLKLNWAITWPTTTGSVSSAQSSTSCVAQLCAAMLRLQASGHAHVCRNSKKIFPFLTVTVPCSILPSCQHAQSSQSAPQPLTGIVYGSGIQRVQLAVNDFINLPPKVLVLCPQSPPQNPFQNFQRDRLSHTIGRMRSLEKHRQPNHVCSCGCLRGLRGGVCEFVFRDRKFWNVRDARLQFG